MAGTVSRGLAAIVALLSCAALGDQYDFRIYKLGNPQTSARADANFRVFARQMGAAITSVNLSPPETLGHSGFSITGELSVIDFGKADIPLPTEGTFSGPLLVPSLHVRKGLPWSFELGVRGGWIEKSRMGIGTVELKWALNEGFTYLPDIAVRGNVSKVINSRDFDLTAGGLDIGLGKRFSIGGMVTLTPYVGWNLVFVGASTGTVDFRPSRSLAEAEGTQGPVDPAVPGQCPTCGPYSDYFVFNSVLAAANTHNRFYGGFRFIGGVAQLGAEFSYSVIGRFHDSVNNEDRDVPPVMAINGTLGLDF